MAIGPGFEIRNETQMRLQLSLEQVGPLYYDLVDPNKTFVRDTGAVWFTIKASVNLDPQDQLTAWDAIWPIGAMTAGVLASAVAVAVTAGGAGPAIAAAGGATAGATGVTGLSATALTSVAALAPTLVGLGVPAGTALVVSGFTVGGTIAAGSAAAGAIAKAFSAENTVAKMAGCYAGPPWPFRQNKKRYAITGGPTFTKLPDGKVKLEGKPLRVVQR